MEEEVKVSYHFEHTYNENQIIPGVNNKNINLSIQSIDINKKKEELQELSNDMKTMPDCAEKYLLQLMIISWERHISQRQDQIQVQGEQLLTKEALLTKLQSQLKIEGLESEKIAELLQNINSLKESINYQTLISYFEQLYNQIVLLKIPETIKLMRENDKAADQIKGQDIILFLGKTGAGKSTTIQFLSGAEMEAVKIQGLTNIQAKSTENSELSKIKTSPFAKSETLYITPVTVDTAKLKMIGKGVYTLCDSPGFGDNRGTEVDIANGIGIVKAIHGCKSVRLIIVLGQKGLGERLEGLMDIVNIMIAMIPNIGDYFDCIQYVFTKYERDHYDQIYPFLLSKYNNLNDSENTNTIFKKILEDLLDKTENNLITLDPLQDQPKQLFSKLINLHQIKNPSEQFMFAISDKSKSAIKDQMILHQRSIANSIIRSDYELIAFKLGQMHQLQELLNYEIIKQIMAECIKSIIQHIKNKFEESKKMIDRSFSHYNQLKESDLEEFRIAIEEAGKVRPIKHHLGEDAIDQGAYQITLQTNVRSLLNDIKQLKQLSDPLVKLILDKLKIIVSKFSQFEEIYYQACHHIEKLLDQQNSICIELIKQCKFEDSVGEIKQIQEAQLQYGTHIEQKKLDQILEFLRANLMDFLLEVSGNMQTTFDKTKLSKDDISDINSSLEVLEQSKTAYLRSNIVNQKEISSIYENQVQLIFNKFKDLKCMFEEQFKLRDSKVLLNVKPIIEQLSLLQEIPIIQLQSTNDYYKILELIIGFVSDLKRDVDHILKQIQAKTSGVNFSQLSSSLQILQNAEWVDQYRPGVYQDVITNIKEQVLDQCEAYSSQLMKWTLDVQNLDKVEQICRKMLEINSMIKLRNLIPEIERPVQEANLWFNKHLTLVFQSIESKFNLEHIKNSEMKTLDYKKAELSLRFLNILRQQNLQTYHPDQASQTSILFNGFEDFLKDYKHYIHIDMIKSHEEILKLQTGHIQNVQNLVNRMKEIHDVVKFDQISQIFEDREQIINYWQKTFDKALIEYKSELRELISANNFQKSLTLLEKVKAMAELDQYTIQKFSAVYSEFQTQIIADNAPKNFKEAQEAIEKNDFQKTSYMLPSIQIENNALFAQYLKTLKILLNSNIEELIEQTKNKIRSFFKLVEKDDEKFQVTLEIIQQNLKKLDNAQKLVSDYFSDTTKQLVEESQKNMSDIITKGLKDLLKQLTGYIANNSYQEAGNMQQKIDTIKEYLEKYIKNEIKDEVDQLQTRLDGSLEELIKQFEVNDFFYVKQKQPKDIYKKLSIKKGNEFYKSTWKRLELIITDKFIALLNEIQESKLSKSQKSAKIKVLEAHLKHLPQELKENLNDELKTAKSDIEQLEHFQAEELKNAITTEDFSKISDLYQDYKSSSIYVTKVREIKDAFYQQAVNFDKELQESIGNKDLQEALEVMDRFYQFRQLHLSTFSQEISKSYESSKKILERLIKTNLDILNNNFNIEKMDSNLSNSIDKMQNNLSENLSIIEDMDIYSNKLEHACNNFTQILQYFYSKREMVQDICPAVDEHISNISKKIGKYFSEHTKIFQDAIRVFNVAVLRDIIKNMKEKDSIYSQSLKQNLELFEKLQMEEFTLIIKQSVSYPDMSKQVVFKVNTIKSEVLAYNFIEGTKKMFKKERTKYYAEYKQKFKLIQQSKFLERVLHSTTYTDFVAYGLQCQKDQENKIKEIKDNAQEIMQKNRLDPEDCKTFSANYNNFIEVVEELDLKNDGYQVQIKELTQLMTQKIDQLQQETKKELKPEVFCDNLIYMKSLSENMEGFKALIDTRINNSLNYYKEKKGGAIAISQLGTLLDNDPFGKILLSEHKIFDGYMLAMFNANTQKHGIDYVLQHIEGDGLDKSVLKKRYEQYINIYNGLIRQHIKKDLDITPLIAEVTSIAGKINYSNQKIEWKGTHTQEIPNILAYIFAIWTLLNAENFFDADGVVEKGNYLLQPHPAQVISIFRLLGIGEKDSKIQNNLVQIGTGEGKSITLGVTSSVLALMGIDVMCACYSEYLSIRDYNSFLRLFNILNITPHIQYGTFNKLCESVINQRGDIRTLVQTAIQGNALNNAVVVGSGRPKVLLIDEVDVFFSKDFYGNVYTPSTSLADPIISELLDYIWNERHSNLTFKEIIESQQFNSLCQKYVGWENLLTEIVKDLLYEVTHFHEQKYIVKDNKIGYQEQDNIVYNVKYGYKTLFSYYQEQLNNHITIDSLNANKNVQVKCGNYSYAEIPHQFQLILGVTGTLKTLSDPEKEVVEKEYKILRKTYAPSVFGANQLTFNQKDSIFVENQDNYLNAINQEIQNRLQGKLPGTKRAVLVFFESKEKLVEFMNCPAFAASRESVKILTEEASSEEKDNVVRTATFSGQISLITKTFGRGTDFKSRDQIVSTNGGIHVITTFLSEEISEEIQIKGRTARQGDQGSFSMVLLDSALEKYLISKQELDQNKGNYYNLLNQKRNAYFKDQYENNRDYIKKTKEAHLESQKFLNELFVKDIGKIKPFLVKFNMGVPPPKPEVKPSKTLVLMDATGSMSGLISKTKNTVQEMFKRLMEILKANKIDEGKVKLQFVVYRNYNSGQQILESSPWETKPENLRKFMNNISASGGWGEEAIEVGLRYVNLENVKDPNDPVSQVILLGDAPANSQQDVQDKRSQTGGDTFWNNLKIPFTYDDIEIQKLKASKIPVHAFYVAEWAKECFRKYSTETGGDFAFLDVNSQAGAEILTNLVAEQILKNVGQESGQSQKFIDQYRQKFGKSYS